MKERSVNDTKLTARLGAVESMPGMGEFRMNLAVKGDNNSNAALNQISCERGVAVFRISNQVPCNAGFVLAKWEGKNEFVCFFEPKPTVCRGTGSFLLPAATVAGGGCGWDRCRAGVARLSRLRGILGFAA